MCASHRGLRVSTADNELVHFAPEQHFREAVARLYRDVEAELRRLLPGADIQHVGSTAIPNSLTKGDLDVQVRVAGSEYAAAKAALENIYAVNTGGFASEDAISFEDYSRQLSLGVHLTVIGGTADIQWRFRDLLAASPDLRAEYDRLKLRFHGGSMSRYRDAKAAFVSQVLQDCAAP
jgi:GrpB-like predicted nucleotidyltransferase (UPF0157 family)